MQVKLLRVIQEQQFERVGGLQTIKVDVRLMTATNRNLLQDVRDGHFREDLFYRLNVIPMHLPPLRERNEDIPALTDYFLEKFNKKLDRAVKGMDERVRDLFIQHEWPGNIRELENLVERVVLMARSDIISFADLPSELKTAAESGLSVPSGALQKPFKDFVRTHMEEIEKRMILTTLDQCGHNVTRAAQQLGLSRKGLQLKMMKYKLRKSD
jgi:transcriptional regulator with PAS, ATPase and Fis domain